MGDAAVAVYYGLCILLSILAILGGVRWRQRRRQQLKQWAAEHAPLAGAAASLSRLDGALRDAEESVHLCDVCGFENLPRRQFCLLCGTRVDGARVESEQFTLRQRRARRRKAWQRQLKDDGALRWVRNDTQPDKATEASAYKLEYEVSLPTTVSPQPDFPVQPNESPKEQPSPCLVRDDAPPDASEDELVERSTPLLPRLELKSLEGVAAEIHALLVNGNRHIQDIKSVNPTDLTIRFVGVDDANLLQGAAEKKAFLCDARLPFPSKLVEFIARATNIQQPVVVPEANVTGGNGPPDATARIQLRVDRDNLLADSMQMLAGLPSETVRLGFRIAFRGETGVDAGGVYREWLLLLNEAVVSPEAGVFALAETLDEAFYLNPHSKEVLGDHHLAHFFATGRLLGRALLEGNVTGFHLALPLLKIILGEPVSLDDLEFFDPEVHQSLQWLLANDDVDVLGLDFTVLEKLPNGSTQIVELVPNGREIDLTDRNKHEFVARKLQYLFFERVEDQLFAFLKGLYQVVPADMLLLFDAEELDYLLSGSDEIDADDWEKHARYTANLIDHPVRQWFWEIVRAMPNEHRRRLLQFSTGASHVPLAGFSGLTSYDDQLCPFTLRGVTIRQSQYVRSHACFNQLDLPLYESKHQLTAMLTALTANDTNVHGFTIV